MTKRKGFFWFTSSKTIKSWEKNAPKLFVDRRLFVGSCSGGGRGPTEPQTSDWPGTHWWSSGGARVQMSQESLA